MDENKIDLLNPGTLTFFIAAFLSDLALLGLIGIAIPGVGIAIALFAIAPHYFFGLVNLVYFWKKTRGWLPKTILIVFWMLPFPLTIGLILAVIASNKLGAFVIEQVVIQTVAIATAGAGEALEAGAAAAEGAEVASTVAESAEAAGEAAEVGTPVGEVGAPGSWATEVDGAQAVGEGAESTTGAAEGAGETGDGISDVMESPEERNPMENLQEELEEPPEEDEFSRTKKRVEKAFDTADQFNQQQKEDNDDEEEDKAA